MLKVNLPPPSKDPLNRFVVVLPFDTQNTKFHLCYHCDCNLKKTFLKQPSPSSYRRKYGLGRLQCNQWREDMMTWNLRHMKHDSDSYHVMRHGLTITQVHYCDYCDGH